MKYERLINAASVEEYKELLAVANGIYQQFYSNDDWLDSVKSAAFDFDNAADNFRRTFIDRETAEDIEVDDATVKQALQPVAQARSQMSMTLSSLIEDLVELQQVIDKLNVGT